MSVQWFIGAGMLVALFGGLFVAGGRLIGWREILAVYGGTVFLLVFVRTATYLMTGE